MAQSGKIRRTLAARRTATVRIAAPAQRREFLVSK
jgi:hypothetical protein